MLGAAAAARYITRQMALLLLAAAHCSVLTLSTLFTPHIAHTTATTTATELFSLGYSIIRMVEGGAGLSTYVVIVVATLMDIGFSIA